MVRSVQLIAQICDCSLMLSYVSFRFLVVVGVPQPNFCFWSSASPDLFKDFWVTV